MALTSEELKRLERIENGLAAHAQAISNLAAKKQLSHVSVVIQKEMDRLQSEIDSLKSQLAALKQ